MRAIEKLNLEALRAVDDIKCEDRPQTKGDFIDGLVVATHMID
jgi:hypothetical protein